MKEITDFRLEPLNEGRFIQTKLARFEYGGESRSWELLQASDSVAILIYHTALDAFIFVKQFRPAVYANGGTGETIELCAGIVDKDMSLEQIASEEVYEECGYSIEPQRLQKVTTFYTSVGFAGSRQTLYYVEVDESDKVGYGGGIEHEDIEVVEVATEGIDKLLFDESIPKTPGLLFAVFWWREKKGKN